MKDYEFLIHYPFLSKPLRVSIPADSLEQAKMMADIQAAPVLDHKPGSMKEQGFPEPYLVERVEDESLAEI